MLFFQIKGFEDQNLKLRSCWLLLLDSLCVDFGVSGRIVGMYCFLCDHLQYVNISWHSSSASKLDSEVPQVLNPLLFAAYVSQVSDVIKSAGLKHHLYADNTQLYFALQRQFENHRTLHVGGPGLVPHK